MARLYHELLPYAFKRFSILSAGRTFVPTLGHLLTRTPLPQSSKPALFTMNILPPMMTVWYHCARKYLGDSVDIVIFDCSGKIDPKDVPGARLQKYLNFYASTKSDEFLRYIAKHRKIAWICDDDIFFVSDHALRFIEKELAIPNTASASLRPRGWWHFEIDGKHYQPSSSYCTAFNRDIFIDTEHLSLAPADGNPHPADNGRPPGRYDTGDKANEILLRKGYRCAIASPEEEAKSITGFTGMSGAVMLLSLFRTPEETLQYYLSPPKKQWQGNVLFGTLSAMLAICTIQECYVRLTGKHYSLPSLPSRSSLERIRKDHEQFLRKDHSFTWMEEAGERLQKAL